MTKVIKSTVVHGGVVAPKSTSEVRRGGLNGRTVLNGVGAPAPALGADDDFYIDTGAWEIYGPRSSGQWGSGTPLIAGGAGPNQGPAGADGKTVRSGATVPSNGLGSDGDFYIRTSNWTIYGPKTGGQWGAPTSVIGPQGPPGTDPPDATSSVKGKVQLAGDLGGTAGAPTVVGEHFDAASVDPIVLGMDSPGQYQAAFMGGGSTTISATSAPGTDIANLSVTVQAGEVAFLIGVATISVAVGARIRLQVMNSSNTVSSTQALMYPPTAGYDRAVVFGMVAPTSNETYRLTAYRDQGTGGGSVFGGSATALHKIVLGGSP